LNFAVSIATFVSAEVTGSAAGYRVAAAEVPEALLNALSATASAFSMRENLYEFQFAGRDSMNDALDQLRAAHCPIESVIPTSSTLEEVFVKAVEQ